MSDDELESIAMDLVVYGLSIQKDGKRVSPQEYFKTHTPDDFDELKQPGSGPREEE